jgi:2'-5' RNA ligase
MRLLSLWLVPVKEDKEYLSKIVNDLAIKYNSPVFIPHLTLFGDTNIELDRFKKGVDKVFENVKPFKIKKTAVSQSELFFKTVFIEFEKSNLLINLFESLVKETGVKNDINNFKPHISLMYKLMSENEKFKIIETLNIKDEFSIGSVYINAPKNGDKDFLNVEGWQTLYKKDLI